MNRSNYLKSPQLPTSLNNSYVNLNQTHTGDRLPSYEENDANSYISAGKRPIATPRSIVQGSVGIKSSTDSPFVISPPLPPNWYSPPSSEKSFSRPPSVVEPKPIKFKSNGKIGSSSSRPMSVASSIMPKNVNKLQTIDEDNMVLPIDKLLELCLYKDEDLQANALGYLQHLTFNNPENKMQVRDCDGLPIIISLIESDNNYVARAALGVLKNISFTDIEMITSDIDKQGGIQKLVNTIHSTEDNNQKELAIDVIWNLSVKYDLKSVILSEVIEDLVECVIYPDSRMIRQDAGNYVEGEEDIDWSTILRNALGIIRNVSYESTEARAKLRNVSGLIDCILYIIFQSGNREVEEEEENPLALIDSKIVENCVCILRNLTYAIQEVVDPEYLQKRQQTDQKTKKSFKKNNSEPTSMIAPRPSTDVPKGVELLWNSKYIITALFPILKNGANAVTLEAACGIIQNLTAGDWEPSKEMKTQFRLQLALPTLIELIEFGTHEVIRSAATALRNLVQEKYCCMLVGKNGLKSLSEKLPMNSRCKDIEPSALAALLSTIYVIILDEVEFMKDFIGNKGLNRCIYVRDNPEYIVHNDQFPDKVKIFSQCILDLLWKTPVTQNILRKNNIKQSDINNPTTGRPSDQSDNNRLHDSIVSEEDSRGPQYPRDERYTRDSFADIVSNQGLKERNSLAYATSSIAGYGDIRMPVSKGINENSRLETIKSGSKASSINGNKSRVISPIPSYHSNDIDSLYSANHHPNQAHYAISPIPFQEKNTKPSNNNRRSSNNSSNYTKTPRPSQDILNNQRYPLQPTIRKISINSNFSNASHIYSRPIKPKPIQSVTSPRSNGKREY